MIGATVMPHNLYLHSALIQTRKINRTPQGIREALKWSKIDSIVALNIAFLINAAILVLAATVFYKTGKTNVGEIREAHQLLSPLLGTGIASALFAIALIASGQSSTITGTLSGQIVMEGYLHLRINPLMRRLITRLLAVIPAAIFIWYTGEENIDQLLIFSQVILSLQLGFAIIPLLHFVSDRNTMKEYAIKIPWQIIGWLIAAVLVYLNLKMGILSLLEHWDSLDSWFIKFIWISFIVLLTAFLLYISLFPLFKNKNELVAPNLHSQPTEVEEITIRHYQKIAIALDFSENDSKVIAAALGHYGNKKEYLLIHVVETAAASMHGHMSADSETIKDNERLQYICRQLADKGINAVGHIGYQHRAKEIVRIIQEEKAELLVIGAHGHKGIKDFIYGTTIDKVRHELHIPVFIVK
jgi:manganese transport protein